MRVDGRGTRFGYVLLAAGLAASCSLGAKQQQADRVVDAVRRTVGAGPVSGRVTASLNLSGSPLEKFSLAGPGFGGKFTAQFRIDDKARRAQLDKASETTAGAVLAVLYDDEQIYVHRPNALPTEARPWYLLRLDDLGKSSGALSISQSTDSICCNLSTAPVGTMAIFGRSRRDTKK